MAAEEQVSKEDTRVSDSGGVVTMGTLNLDGSWVPKPGGCQIERQVQVMVRDACLCNTNAYYAVTVLDKQRHVLDALTVSTAQGEDTDNEGDDDSSLTYEFRSVWAPDRIHWNVWLNQQWVWRTLLAVSMILMANALIEEPLDDRLEFWGWSLSEVPHELAHTVFFVGHGILLGLFVVSFWGIWPTRHDWLAKEPKRPVKAKKGLVKPVRCVRASYSRAHCWV